MKKKLNFNTEIFYLYTNIIKSLRQYTMQTHANLTMAFMPELAAELFTKKSKKHGGSIKDGLAKRVHSLGHQFALSYLINPDVDTGYALEVGHDLFEGTTFRKAALKQKLSPENLDVFCKASFKASLRWKHQMEDAMHTFIGSDGSEPTMVQSSSVVGCYSKRFKHHSGSLDFQGTSYGYRAIALPTDKESGNVLVVLPEKIIEDNDLLKSISDDALEKWTEDLFTEVMTEAVVIPHFSKTVEGGVDLLTEDMYSRLKGKCEHLRMNLNMTLHLDSEGVKSSSDMKVVGGSRGGRPRPPPPVAPFEVDRPCVYIGLQEEVELFRAFANGDGLTILSQEEVKAREQEKNQKFALRKVLRGVPYNCAQYTKGLWYALKKKSLKELQEKKRILDAILEDTQERESLDQWLNVIEYGDEDFVKRRVQVSGSTQEGEKLLYKRQVKDLEIDNLIAYYDDLTFTHMVEMENAFS